MRGHSVSSSDVDALFKLPHGEFTAARNALVAELKKRHIYISQRGQSLRFAPHLHITPQDIQRLTDSLRELVR